MDRLGIRHKAWTVRQDAGFGRWRGLGTGWLGEVGTCQEKEGRDQEEAVISYDGSGTYASASLLPHSWDDAVHSALSCPTPLFLPAG